MLMVNDETHGALDEDARDGVTTRSRRSADRFVGLPIAHPLEVARLLEREGKPAEVIAAGLLHDTLEKTATTRAELQHRFGTRVAGLVESVSDDPSIGDYESRKRELRERVAHAGPDTVAIFAADKISKVRELALLPTSRLPETTTRVKLAHYRATLKMLRRVAPDAVLVNRLNAELSQLLARTTTANTTTARSKRSNQRSRTSRRA